MTMLRPFSKSILTAVIVLMTAAPALPHPHVTIEGWSDVIFNDDGKIIGLYIEWAFDQGYSDYAVDGLDANGDGVYSTQELSALTQENITALKDYRYFTYAKADGKPVAYLDAVEYVHVLAGGVLKLHFKVPFAEPVDPTRQEFVYKIYDPTFYIAIDYAKTKPVNVIGTLPEKCRIELGEIAFDQQVEETKLMLAQKDKNWQPAEEEDFGGLFAQPVSVICGPKTS